MVRGSGSRIWVQGLGFRISGFGFDTASRFERTYTSHSTPDWAFRVSGLTFLLYNLGHGQGFGVEDLGLGPQVSDLIPHRDSNERTLPTQSPTPPPPTPPVGTGPPQHLGTNGPRDHLRDFPVSEKGVKERER